MFCVRLALVGIIFLFQRSYAVSDLVSTPQGHTQTVHERESVIHTDAVLRNGAEKETQDLVEQAPLLSIELLQNRHSFDKKTDALLKNFTPDQWRSYCATKISDLQNVPQNTVHYVGDEHDVYHQYNLYQYENFIVYLKTLPHFNEAIIALADQISADEQFAEQFEDRQGWDHRKFRERCASWFKEVFAPTPFRGEHKLNLADFICAQAVLARKEIAAQAQQVIIKKCCNTQANQEYLQEYLSRSEKQKDSLVMPPELARELAVINTYRRAHYCLDAQDLQQGTLTQRCELVLHESARRRMDERSHAIQETFKLFSDEQRAWQALAQLQEYQLWDAATLPMVLKLGINVKEFSAVRGYPIQIQIHNELVHIMKEAVLLQAHLVDELFSALNKGALACVQRACQFNKAGDLPKAFDLTDMCWATLNYLKGVAFGIVQEVKILGQMPIIQGVGKGIIQFCENTAALVVALDDVLNRPDLPLSLMMDKALLLTRFLPLF